jgi:hypothetical protein
MNGMQVLEACVEMATLRPASFVVAAASTAVLIGILFWRLLRRRPSSVEIAAALPEDSPLLGIPRSCPGEAARLGLGIARCDMCQAEYPYDTMLRELGRRLHQRGVHQDRQGGGIVVQNPKIASCHQCDLRFCRECWAGRRDDPTCPLCGEHLDPAYLDSREDKSGGAVGSVDAHLKPRIPAREAGPVAILGESV